MPLATSPYEPNGRAVAPPHEFEFALQAENDRLRALLAKQERRLRRQRAESLDAIDRERRRIERNLHDGVQQHLVSIALKLRLLKTRVETEPAVAANQIDEAIDDLVTAAGELRMMAIGMHPPGLEDGGLPRAIGELASHSPLKVTVTGVPRDRFSARVESAVYFVVAEALTNVHKHADAETVTIDVSERDGTIAVEVRDDGVGGADPAAGSGLRGLAERIEAFDGSLSVVDVVGGGTALRASIRTDTERSADARLASVPATAENSPVASTFR